MTDEELGEIFRAARFPEFQTATDDARDLQEWMTAFRMRAQPDRGRRTVPIADRFKFRDRGC